MSRAPSREALPGGLTKPVTKKECLIGLVRWTENPNLRCPAH